MPNADAATIIADALPTLEWPGDEQSKPVILPLPTFRNSGMPTAQADHFAKEAGLPHADICKLTAEAVVHALESKGYRILDANAAAELHAAAAANDDRRHRQVTFYCHCGTKLFSGNVKDFATDRAEISPNVIKAVQILSAECALSHGRTA